MNERENFRHIRNLSDEDLDSFETDVQSFCLKDYETNKSWNLTKTGG